MKYKEILLHSNNTDPGIPGCLSVQISLYYTVDSRYLDLAYLE